MKFIHYLVIAIVGALITIYGRILAVRWTEYYRLRALLKAEFEGIITKFKDKTPEHPASYVENSHIDILVRDTLNIMPPWKSKRFRAYWEEYRYDKQVHNMVPREYTQRSPDYVRRLISDRLHNLISKL